MSTVARHKWSPDRANKFSLDGGYFRKLALTEADVAAEFVCKLRELGGFNAHMETILPSHRHRSKTFRVDCLITRPDERGERVVMAVEFKRPKRQVLTRTRQAEAYEALGVAWDYCIGLEGIEPIIRRLRAWRPL